MALLEACNLRETLFADFRRKRVGCVVSAVVHVLSKPNSDDDDDDGEDVGDASAYGTWSEDDDDGDNDYDGDTGSEADDVVHAATVDDADAADMSWHHADSDGPFELQVLDHNF